MENKQTTVVKNFKEKSIIVTSILNANVAKVWRCYTEPALLDRWWGPAPWRAVTKTMKFEEGGFWLYAMVSPEGEKHWGIMNYIAIDYHKSFDLEDGFCDENGNINHELPISKGTMVFTNTSNGTIVKFKMTYSNEEQLKKLIEMGFEEGIMACLEQLKSLISTI